MWQTTPEHADELKGVIFVIIPNDKINQNQDNFLKKGLNPPVRYR